MSDTEHAENGPPPQGPRENMITTAMRFLQNPKVQQSPVSQRRDFLEKKGLTKEEVHLAMERSGANSKTVSEAVSQPGAQIYQQQPQVIGAPVSTMSKVKDYMAYFIIASGATYGIYQLVKKYLLTYLYGPTAKDEQLAKVESTVRELQISLNETMGKLQETLSFLQELVTNQSNKVKFVSEQITAQRGPYAMAQIQDSQFTNEIKDEIKSLKGLLLSRKQFPPTPSTTPVLPAWQRSQTPLDETKKVSKEPTNGTADELSQKSLSVTLPSPVLESSVTSSIEPNPSEKMSPTSKQQTKMYTEDGTDPVKVIIGKEEVMSFSEVEQVSLKKEVGMEVTDEPIISQQAPTTVNSVVT